MPDHPPLHPGDPPASRSTGGRPGIPGIAARVAAEEALRRLLPPASRPHHVRIDRDREGVPWARVDGRRLPLSLAHTGHRAAAAARTEGRVGVDVELIQPLAAQASRYFLSPTEERALQGWCDPATATLAAWTVKEAVLKALGVGLCVPPRRVTIRSMEAPGPVAVSVEGAEVGAACWSDDGAIVAVAWVGPDAPELRISRGEL